MMPSRAHIENRDLVSVDGLGERGEVGHPVGPLVGRASDNLDFGCARDVVDTDTREFTPRIGDLVFVRADQRQRGTPRVQPSQVCHE